jgi:hypothetical protein
MKRVVVPTIVLAAIVSWLLFSRSKSETRPGKSHFVAEPSLNSGEDADLPRTRDPEQPPGRAQEAQPREAPVENVPAPASVSERTETRFDVRWDTPGLCGTQDVGRVLHRDALLATFVQMDAIATPAFYDPGVDPAVLKEIPWFQNYVVNDMPIPAGLNALALPTIYIYRNIDQMLSVSCVNHAAIGYYDGAIHIAGDVRLGSQPIAETLIHEYVHYLLNKSGIRLPMWLHEGLAMKSANEQWWHDPSLGLQSWLVERHLPFAAMVTAFPATADEKFALAVYYQSLMMTKFVLERETRAGAKGLSALLVALARRQVSAADAFSWSTDLDGDALELAWAEFLTRQELLHRSFDQQSR